ncbi:MAG: CocE/NonD family hydrolase C-terminal non-catalytic domain-containing protein, partial [Actinomycetota bacterium]
LVGPGPGGGDGAADGNPAPAEELGRSAVRQEILPPVPRVQAMLGVPRVHLSGEVLGVQGFAFLELVDVAPDGTRVTIDDQVMPIALAGGSVDRTIDLHGVSWRLFRGHSLELEITTGSAQYAIPRTGPYAIDLTADVSLPLTRL